MNLKEFKKCFEDLDIRELNLLKRIISEHNDIIILGNGGSNAISCHIAQDYTKVLKKRVLCFGESSRLSCYANDYGWDSAYLQFLREFSNENTLVILLSSSGESNNILKCAKFCSSKCMEYVILTGFSKDNTLKRSYENDSSLDFWIDSSDYGVIESLHELILHSVL